MDAEARKVALTVWAATDPAKRVYGITDDVKEVSFNTILVCFPKLTRKSSIPVSVMKKAEKIL